MAWLRKTQQKIKETRREVKPGSHLKNLIKQKSGFDKKH